MNPWYLLAILAGAIGVGTLASNAAKAAMPRVTNWSLVLLPTPGAGQWDLWVTGLNGHVGPAMLSLIPGGQMIYVPAAQVMSQPPTKDWVYTFVPRGSASPFSIVVPAEVIAAWQAAPKTEIVRRAAASHAYGAQQAANLAQSAYVQQLLAQQQGAPAPSTAAQDINGLIQQVKAILASVPPSGSDASTYAFWLATTALQVPSIISEVQQAITAIQNNTAQGDLATLQALLPQILHVVATVSAAAASAPSPSTAPSSSDGSNYGS